LIKRVVLAVAWSLLLPSPNLSFYTSRFPWAVYFLYSCQQPAVFWYCVFLCFVDLVSRNPTQVFHFVFIMCGAFLCSLLGRCSYECSETFLHLCLWCLSVCVFFYSPLTESWVINVVLMHMILILCATDLILGSPPKLYARFSPQILHLVSN